MIEINNLTKIRVDQRRIKNFIIQVTRFLKIRKSISLAFVDSREIKKLSRIHLGKDKVTDVLSFNGEGDFLGEIIVSLPQAKKQAQKEKHSTEREIKVLVLHGLLHLIGFDHEKPRDREKMEKRSKEILKILKA